MVRCDDNDADANLCVDIVFKRRNDRDMKHNLSRRLPESSWCADFPEDRVKRLTLIQASIHATVVNRQAIVQS